VKAPPPAMASGYRIGGQADYVQLSAFAIPLSSAHATRDLAEKKAVFSLANNLAMHDSRALIIHLKDERMFLVSIPSISLRPLKKRVGDRKSGDRKSLSRDWGAG